MRGISWPAEYSGRAIANQFSESWVGNEQAFSLALDELRPQYERALATDDVGTKAIWAGEVADLIKDVQPARSIVEATLKGYADTVAKLGRTL